MHAAVRTSVLSGATLLTAGAIAVAPMQPLAHVPSIPSISHAMSTAAVNLTSSPFDLYGQVLGTAAGNLQADVKSYLDMGLFPILRQILTNQVGTMTGLVDALGDSGRAVFTALTTQVPGYLGSAVGDLGQANIEGALNNLQLAIVLPIFAAINPIGTLPKALGNLISQPLQSVINIANDLPNLMLALGVGLIGPVASTIGAMGTATQNVINAVQAGDLGKLATAVIQAPATIIDGLLNGGYGPNLGALLGLDIPGFSIFGGGLLGGGATVPGGTTIAGTVQAIVAVVRSILTDITPAKPAAATAATTAAKAVSDVASVPSTTAATVTLSTAATTKAAAAADPTSTDKAKTAGSTSEATGSATDATTKATTTTETSTDTKTGTSTGSGTDAKTTGSVAGSTSATDSKTGDTKTGSSSSSGSDSSAGSGSGSDGGTKTTTSGHKGHEGKSSSGSSSGSGSSSASGSGSGSGSASGSGSDSGAKGSPSKGSHSGSKSKSESHSAA